VGLSVLSTGRGAVLVQREGGRCEAWTGAETGRVKIPRCTFLRPSMSPADVCKRGHRSPRKKNAGGSALNKGKFHRRLLDRMEGGRKSQSVSFWRGCPASRPEDGSAWERCRPRAYVKGSRQAANDFCRAANRRSGVLNFSKAGQRSCSKARHRPDRCIFLTSQPPGLHVDDGGDVDEVLAGKAGRTTAIR